MTIIGSLRKFFLIVLLAAAVYAAGYYSSPAPDATADNLRLDDQEATILAIKKVTPSVVSILVYDNIEYASYDFTTGKRTMVKEKIEKGSGTGFIISADGLILTNKHVVEIAEGKSAEYKIILSGGKQYFAQLIGKDPINDLAVLKIFDKNLPVVELGDSDKLETGATVIAIGNSVGRYKNSATKGIVSGLGRNLTASDSRGNAEALDNVIQTDADINLGNSGGPLIDLSGKVVGINVAIDQTGSGLSFAIPVNDAKTVVKTVREIGRIVRPRLGVKHVMVTQEIALEKKLPRTAGAYLESRDEAAVISGSPADKAGLKAGDIIYEVNGTKVEGKNTLQSLIQKYMPGDKIFLKIQRGGEVMNKEAVLDEFRAD